MLIKRKLLKHGLIASLPPVLALSFVLCPSTSASIFTTWTCIDFTTDSVPALVARGDRARA